MSVRYECLTCGHAFPIDASEDDARLAPARTDTCPRCAQPVGCGPVRCRRCGNGFELAFPHWHVRCDRAEGECRACGARYVSPCIC